MVVRMRRLVALVLIAAALYGGYWVIGSRATLAGARQALDGMKAQGTADFGDVSIRGFPSRFDLTITEPRLRSLDGRMEWSAPFAQVFALSYRPNHVIAVLPHDQRLTIAGAPLAITTEDLRASAVLGATGLLPLDHAQTVGKVLRVTDAEGDGLSGSELRAAVRTADAAQNRYDIAAEASGLAPIGASVPLWTTVAGDPSATGWLRVQTTATFDRPLDRRAVDGPIRITDLQVSALQATYGQFDLQGTGALSISADGQPEGRLDLSVKGWQGLPQVMVETGMIKPEVAPTVTKILTALSVGSGGADGTLHLPLTLADGQMSLGPVPLGPVPRL